MPAYRPLRFDTRSKSDTLGAARWRPSAIHKKLVFALVLGVCALLVTTVSAQEPPTGEKAAVSEKPAAAHPVDGAATDTTGKAATLHPGGASSDPNIPGLGGLSCPGTNAERFAELDAMDDATLEAEVVRLRAAVTKDPTSLAAVVATSSAVMTRWRRLPDTKREAVMTVRTCNAEHDLLPVAYREGLSGELLDENYALFVDFAARNHGHAEVSPEHVVCAAITPLFNAARMHDFDSLPRLTKALAKAVPAAWLREAMEGVGEVLLIEEGGWALNLEETMRVAREAGIDSAPIRNLQYYGYICQGRMEEGRALLVETLKLAPEDTTIQENLSWVEARIKQDGAENKK